MTASTSVFRTENLQKKFKLMGYDSWLILVVVIMISFGLVMVYSASWDVSFRLYSDPNAIIRRQVVNLFIGLIALLVAARVPLKWIRALALPGILAVIFALLAVLFINVGVGPKRAFLSGSVQPSELAKLAMIIYLAVWMESKEDRLLEWGYGLVPLVLMIGLVAGLILLQPDLSAAITVGVVALVMFYLAGSPLVQTMTIALGSAGVGLLLVRVSNTGRQRWVEYINGLINVEEASYHVKHSLQAFHSGGLLGRGLGASREKFGLLPAPHTDSIFAVIGEEIGLLGAVIVLSLFAFLILRGFKISRHQPDKLATLLASGITFWIGLEAVVNMAVLLGLLPFAGNALPLFSYGGSSLVTNMAAVGLLLNISRRKPIEGKAKEHVTSIGFGRRNRRGRVSRVGRRGSSRRKI